MIIKFESNFPKKHKNYIKLLEEDGLLEPLVKRARIKSGIPGKGVADKNKYVRRMNKDQKLTLAKYANLIANYYELDTFQWLAPLINLILTGTISPPKKRRFPPIKLEWNPKNTLKIVITERTSQRAIRGYLKRNKTKINRYLNSLPKPAITQVTNVDMKNEVLRLRKIKKKRKKKAYSEIAKILFEKYGEPLHQGDVGKLVNRYKGSVSKLTKVDKDPRRKSLIDDLIEGKRDLI